MSTARRHDLTDHANITDESQTFKKAFQTVDKPPVTERDIHEQYMQDPPNNQSQTMEFFSTERHPRGQKEGAREENDPKQDGVLGDQPTGKVLKQDALQEITTESSVHP